MKNRRMRIGIDVGGTFTHGVLINDEGEILARTKVLTTHKARQGVAEGVVNCLMALTEGVDLSEIESINHSTTQATNALLEGDLSPVHAYVIHRSGEGFIVRRQLGFREIRLSQYSRIPVSFQFFEESIPKPPSQISQPILIAQTLTQAENLEDKTIAEWSALLKDDAGLNLVQPATSISRLLGLKGRVKTGIINCAMLPTMLRTLKFTEQALSSLGINVPLCVIKSDGGAMPKELVFLKPISALLSGPAAGAGAALHFAGITEGLFLDIGGTSTDISFIHGGRIRTRSASVGSHRLQVQTLDLRTIALGGGSLIGVDKAGKLILGPRSAHLAGLHYLSFTPEDKLKEGCLGNYQEGASGATYFTWDMPEERAGFTLTDFANVAGIIPESDEACRESEKLAPAFERLLKALKMRSYEFEARISARILEAFTPVYQEFIRLFRPDRRLLRLVGGGGGVYSALPVIARNLKLPFEVVNNYPIISAIGAALSATTVSIRIPSEEGGPEDIERLRQLAYEELARAGVMLESAHLEFEFDKSAHILALTASASRPHEAIGKVKSEKELEERARQLLSERAVSKEFENINFVVFLSAQKRRFLRSERFLVVMDRLGRGRLLEKNCTLIKAFGAEKMRQLVSEAYLSQKSYTDAGEIAPRIAVISPSRIYNLSSLHSVEAALKILSEEQSRSDNFLIIILPSES